MIKYIGKSIFIILVPMILLIIAFGSVFFYSENGNKNNFIPSNVEKQKKRIVFVSPQTDYPVWLQAKIGFDDAAKEFGFYGSWVGGGNCNINDMLKEIDIAISEKADGIITCPLNPSNFASKFKEALEKNIPIITVAVDAELENLRSANVGSNYIELGFKQAKALHQKVGDKMRVGIIMSNLDTRNQMIMCASLRSYLSTVPDAEIVAIDEDWSDPVMGVAVFSKMITEHPQINVIFGTEGGGVSGFGKVIREKGLQDKVIIIGMDIIQDNLNAVKDGSIYGLMSQDFYTMGYLAGKYAYQKAMGKEVPSITYTDTELITKENVDRVKSIK